MLQKIRYRLAWNRAHRLNRQGEGLVEVECSQQGRRIYFTTHVYVRPENWKCGRIVGLPNADLLNHALYTMIYQMERTELEFIRREVDVSLFMLREAVKNKVSPAALLRDFGLQVVSQSDRKRLTVANYVTLLNNIDRFRQNTIVTDVDYTFVSRYDQWLREQGVAHNTRVSRLRLLRALMNEARRRDLVASNPFDRFRIQGMKSKHGHLTGQQLAQLERMQLSGTEERVRDAFLIGCYTGLRYSDIISLRQPHIGADGWITKQMQKTGFTVEIPAGQLFGGKFMRLVEKYGGNISRLTQHIPGNSLTNRTLRHLIDRIDGDQGITFHSSRHTFATLLGQQGVPLQTIQRLLGHQDIQTTQIYSETTRTGIMADLTANRKKKKK